MESEIKNILVNAITNRELSIQFSKHVRGKLLDIGCGTKPYSQLLSKYCSEHVGVDHYSTQHDKTNIDIFSTAYKIPVPDQSFDSVICTGVLEHLEEPGVALKECIRVLKSNGVAIYTVPFIWHLHEEPRDYYRYTKYGLDYQFQKAGLEVIEIKALSGFWVTFGQLLVYNLYRFNIGPLRWLRIIDAFGLMLQGLVYHLDRFDRTEQWTWAYIIVARKK
jgi:SAM-dependent methyltransferase